jgi:hypothetical protein
MRARDYLGFPLLAVGISVVMLGHHWLGLVWFWGGALVAGLGVAVVASGGLQERIDRALCSYRGPGDYGNRDYHGRGGGDFSSHDTGADGGSGSSE